MNLSRKWVALVLAISLCASLVASQAIAYGSGRPMEGPIDPPWQTISGEPDTSGGGGRLVEWLDPDSPTSVGIVVRLTLWFGLRDRSTRQSTALSRSLQAPTRSSNR